MYSLRSINLYDSRSHRAHPTLITLSKTPSHPPLSEHVPSFQMETQIAETFKARRILPLSFFAQFFLEDVDKKMFRL